MNFMYLMNVPDISQNGSNETYLASVSMSSSILGEQATQLHSEASSGSEFTRSIFLQPSLPSGPKVCFVASVFPFVTLGQWKETEGMVASETVARGRGSSPSLC